MGDSKSNKEASFDEELLFRVYCYLSVAATHLRTNFELSRLVEPADLSPSKRAHWGSLPGVNAVYASKRVFEARSRARCRIVLGTGHAGLSTLIDAFLFGELVLSGKPVATNLEGFAKLSTALLAESEVSLEVGPNYPGLRFPTGSIGHALGYAQGVALAQSKSNTIALLGDGECEAGSTLSALLAHVAEFGSLHGLLPIINLNGFRMGGRSHLAHLGTASILRLLQSFGLEPTVAKLEHHDISGTLLRISATSGSAFVIKANQIICLDGDKGHSAPKEIEGQPFAGSVQSHKSTLRNVGCEFAAADILNGWLSSYDVAPFSESGELNSEVADLIDRLKLTHQDELPPCPESNSPKLTVSTRPKAHESPVQGLRGFIWDHLRSGRDFKLFSPDEASSNLGASFVSELDPSEDSSQRGAVLHEVLNEDLCLAWMAGWRSQQRLGLMITYEAFAPILLNQLLQLRKYMLAWQSERGKPGFSITIVLSSLGWTNSASHHEPFFADALLPLIERGILEVHYPLDGEAVRRVLETSAEAELGIHIVAIDKHATGGIASTYENQSYEFRWAKFGDSEKAETVVISVGSNAFRNAKTAIEEFSASNKRVGVLHVCCENLTCLFDDAVFRKSQLFELLSTAKSTVWVVNGRDRAVSERARALLPEATKVIVHGYKDVQQTPSGEARNRANEVDVASIGRSIAECAIARL